MGFSWILSVRPDSTPAVALFGGTRCSELGGGWSTHRASHNHFGFRAHFPNDCSQGKALRPALAERSKVPKIFLPAGWSGPLCMSRTALPWLSMWTLLVIEKVSWRRLISLVLSDCLTPCKILPRPKQPGRRGGLLAAGPPGPAL